MMPHQNDTLKMIFRKWFFQNDISKMILSKRFISKRKQNDTFWNRNIHEVTVSFAFPSSPVGNCTSIAFFAFSSRHRSGKETTTFKTEHSFGFVGQNEGVVQKQIVETRNEELLFEKRWKQLFCFVKRRECDVRKWSTFILKKRRFTENDLFEECKMILFETDQNDTFWKTLPLKTH